MCRVKLKDCVRSDILLNRLRIPDISEVCRVNRLRWFRHVERNSGWTKGCAEYNVDGRTRCGGQRKKWQTVVSEDLKLMGISEEMTSDRKKWREVIHKRIRANHRTTSTQ